MINERALQVGKICLCFVGYKKAFDRINPAKLVQVVEAAGTPELAILSPIRKHVAKIDKSVPLSRKINFIKFVLRYYNEILR